ncbi:hypothetical protein BGX34_004607, partial [Mortierella sp. NVP85]
GPGQCIDSITIKGQYNHISQSAYISILQAAKRPFRVFDLRMDNFSQDVFDQKSLSSCPSLERINAKYINAKHINAKHINAKHINAKYITAKDIVEGQPWACLGLKEFRVMTTMGFRIKLDRGAQRRRFTEISVKGYEATSFHDVTNVIYIYAHSLVPIAPHGTFSKE